MEKEVKRIVDVLVNPYDKSIGSVIRETCATLETVRRTLDAWRDVGVAITRLANSAREAIDANKNSVEG